ncbi:MAG: alpha/beta hydrolase [Roseburia sp.]|nr:alpha/beta hydrolase [Anaeroplasma bactoclasticum]MCM1196060.1 alpha/beta hydrolase [Roseburia sp.]MCM1556745.1 alpha/beta hydrolase [Anaeroplasma bactoclasticum]
MLLHGWGASLLTFNKLAKTLSNNFKVYRIDLPGFGESAVGVPLGVEEIAEIIHDFVVELGLEAPILCGHSYGGRVAIVYASKYSVEKLVLISSAGLKQKLKFSKWFKIRVYKILKKCHLPVKMGSTDYQNADNVKRIMLVKAVNTDLKKELKRIAAPTLLLYGTKDTVTPLSLGYKMKEHIYNSELIELEECGHFPYLERPSIFSLILMSFLVGEAHDY